MAKVITEIDCDGKNCGNCNHLEPSVDHCYCWLFEETVERKDKEAVRCKKCLKNEIKE